MFKSDLADIGNILPGQTVDVVWELIGDPSQIIHYEPDCGCTVNTRAEGNKVIAAFTESDAQNLNDDQKANWYPTGHMPVTKGITVYFKDDKNLWIIGPDNKQRLNPDKLQAKLTFIGYVLVKQPNVASQEPKVTV